MSSFVTKAEAYRACLKLWTIIVETRTKSRAPTIMKKEIMEMLGYTSVLHYCPLCDYTDMGTAAECPLSENISGCEMTCTRAGYPYSVWEDAVGDGRHDDALVAAKEFLHILNKYLRNP